MKRFACITLDTEVDRDPQWRISDPVSFSSITSGIPDLLTPLFKKYGVKPTYLLSAEVLEDAESVKVLARLFERGEAELGTHLHVEFVEPQRTRFNKTMGGMMVGATQRQLEPELEQQKLHNLSASFERVFGMRPTSFRAGRFGMSDSTLGILAQLGYVVDSSVTPGLYWDYVEGSIDYTNHTCEPSWSSFGPAKILELPVSVRPRGPLAPMVRSLPMLPRRALLKLAKRYTAYSWLRPSFASGSEMIEHLTASSENLLVMMLHSMEIIPKASPYAQTRAEVEKILASMDEFFAHCVENDIGFISLTEAASHVPA